MTTPPDALSNASPSSATVEVLMERAKRLQSSNNATLRELQSMRAEEHACRQQLLSSDYPTIHRWCQEADIFLRDLDCLPQDDDDAADFDTNYRGDAAEHSSARPRGKVPRRQQRTEFLQEVVASQVQVLHGLSSEHRPQIC